MIAMGLAGLVVVVLLAIAILPGKKKDIATLFPTSLPTSFPTSLMQSPPNVNLRQQQLSEEAEAVASDYQARAQDAWLSEVRSKASKYFAKD